MHNQAELLNYLKKLKSVKSVQLFCDIETLTVNKLAGREKPSRYHSYTYSLAIAYFKDNDDFPNVAVFNNFVDFFEKVKEKKIRKSLQFEMIFHNGEKFDNHFAINELSKHFNLPIFNEFNKSLNNEANANNKKMANLDSDTKNKGCILESRIKSSNNVSVNAFIHSRKIVFTDSFKKMNTSIKVLGNMLLNNHLITEEYLKTDFDYQAFDKDYDMSENDIKAYVKHCNIWKIVIIFEIGNC